VPTMLGEPDAPASNQAGKRITPAVHWGIRVMSVGFFVEREGAVVWRGPMIHKLLQQFIEDVDWGNLDYLVVDLPPGTGDVQLTLVQKLKIDGVVIVSTPQEIALIDARRAAAMFRKTATPILGVIENMAYFPDPATGAHIPIFGAGGAREEAKRLGAPLLAEIPIDIALRQGCDDGVPVVVSDPEGRVAAAFRDAAKALR